MNPPFAHQYQLLLQPAIGAISANSSVGDLVAILPLVLTLFSAGPLDDRVCSPI
jgi:hypothetical protein